METGIYIKNNHKNYVPWKCLVKDFGKLSEMDVTEKYASKYILHKKKIKDCYDTIKYEISKVQL